MQTGHFLRKMPIFPVNSRFPDLRIAAMPRLLTKIAMAVCGWLPVYSDRIVRELHPIPFYLLQRKKHCSQ